MEDETNLDAIHRLYGEIVETTGKIKTVKSDLKDVAEQNDEWRSLQDEIKEANAKKVTAKKLLEADKDYQIINAELGELKFKHKDLLEIMSYHLNRYRAETGAEVVKDPEGEAREIITNSKLGKPNPLLAEGGTPRASKKPVKGQVSIESQIDGYGKPSSEVRQ
jgi:hypothetical protein